MLGNSGDESISVEEQPALTASHGQPGNVAVPEPWGFSAGNSKDARSIGAEQGVSPPIRASSSGTNQAPTVGPIPQAFDEMNFTLSDQHHVLRAGTQQSTGVVEEMVDFGRTSDRIRINAETAATLQAGGGGAGAKTGLYMEKYGVRRLTPVECERLQGFPDGWTEPAGSDSARYKALGNAVTVNTVRWVLGRMLEQSGEAIQTMSTPVQSQPVKAAAMLNFQGSKGNNVTNDGSESFTLNAMHGHDVHAVVVEKS
jgi:DNA (cytosine-5)-methyltransferase 1